MQKNLKDHYFCQGGYVFMFTKFGGKLAHDPLKKPLDFGGNRDHVT